MSLKELKRNEKGQSVIFAIFTMIAIIFIVALVLNVFAPLMSEFMAFSNELVESNPDMYYQEDIYNAQTTTLTFFKYITLFVSITLVAYVLNIAIRRKWQEKEY